MSIHVNLEELEDVLDDFLEKRDDYSKKVHVIREALRRFFKQEPTDNRKQLALKEVLSRKFTVPETFVLPGSFYTTLFVLAQAAPNSSAKETWGVIYISGVDKTNKQVYDEIRDETRTLLTERYGKEAQAIQENGST